MLASIQIRPPRQFNPQGIEEPVIGVRLCVVPNAVTVYLHPPANHFGTVLLCRLLQARLELAGVRVASATGTLELNWSYYLFAVSELVPALEAIKAELEKLGLLPAAQIAWHDPREAVFRLWYPQAGRFDRPAGELWEAYDKFQEALRAAAKKLQPLADETAGK